MSNLTPDDMAAAREHIQRTINERELFKLWWAEAHTPPRNVSEMSKAEIAWAAWLHRSRMKAP